MLVAIAGGVGAARLLRGMAAVVDPASISVVSYTETRPFVVRVNDTGGDVSALLPPPKKGRRRRASSDAVVGGGAGPGAGVGAQDPAQGSEGRARRPSPTGRPA